MYYMNKTFTVQIGKSDVIPQILDQPVCLTIYFMFYNCMLEKKIFEKIFEKIF